MKKKIKLLILISSAILVGFQIPVLARYYEKFSKISGNAVIAEPIIKVESLQDTIITAVNKESKIQEYYFIIKNFESDSINKRINEVDFLCDIEIKNSSENFPVKYELYDCKTGAELLNGTLKATEIEISKNVEIENKYKLVLYWNSVQNMSCYNDVEIIVTANQKNN